MTNCVPRLCYIEAKVRDERCWINRTSGKAGDIVEQTLQEDIVQIKLPKNVRQIGTIDKKSVIYIEDYVVTYLEQMARKEKLQFGAAALYGKTVFQKDEKYVFISAAVFEEDKPALQTGPGDVIEHGPTENMLSTFLENEEKYFSGLKPVGVAVIHKDSVRIPDAWIRKNKMDSLLGCGAVLIDLNTEGDGAEYFFYNEESIVLQPGHYIYYERNELMQSFLVEWHENAQTGLSEEPLDYVAGTCRMVMEDKKEDKIQEKSINWVSASGLLGLIAVSAIGIIVMNHYNVSGRDERMTGQMQNQTSSASQDQLPAQDSPDDPAYPTSDLSVRVEDNPEDGTEADGQHAGAAGTPSGGEYAQTGQQQTETVPEADGTEVSGVLPGEQTAGEITEADGQEEPDTGMETSGEAVTQRTPVEYVIEKGDTLCEISRRYYGTIGKVSMICEYNQIEDQDSIFYGQTIVLP